MLTIPVNVFPNDATEPLFASVRYVSFLQGPEGSPNAPELQEKVERRKYLPLLFKSGALHPSNS